MLQNTIEVVKSVSNVSRETEDRLTHYVNQIIKWQKAQNLISPKTLGEIWPRHIADCVYLPELAGGPSRWLDFGSGAGLPGIVTAIIQKEQRRGHVHLVESNKRKVSFMRTIIRELDLDATVHASRIEKVDAELAQEADFVSARALTSLSELLAMVYRFQNEKLVCFFHKGRDINEEIQLASNQWSYDLVKNNSRIVEDSYIVEVRNIQPKDNS